MGLACSESRPGNVSLGQAYESIRRWCTRNLWQLRPELNGSEDAAQAKALIMALPPASELNDLELRAVLGEVLYGYLEWAYHRRDGRFKVAAYAHAALEEAGLHWSLSDTERQRLKGSALWPYLTLGRLATTGSAGH